MKKNSAAAIALLLVLIGLALLARGSLTGLLVEHAPGTVETISVNRSLTATYVTIPLNATMRVRSVSITGSGIGADPYVNIGGRTYRLSSNSSNVLSGLVTGLTAPRRDTPLNSSRVVRREASVATNLTYGNGPYDVDNNGIVGPQGAVDFQVSGQPACVIWTVVTQTASLFCRGNASCCTRLGFPYQNGSATYLALTRASAGGTDGEVLARASNETFSNPLTFSFAGPPERYATYASSCGQACSIDRLASSITIGTRNGRLDLTSVEITYEPLNATTTNDTVVLYEANGTSGRIAGSPGGSRPAGRTAVVQATLVTSLDQGRRERVLIRNASGVHSRVLDKAAFDSLVANGSVSEAAIDAPVSVLATDALGITGISAVQNATGLSGAGETVCVVDTGVNVQILRDANAQFSTFNVLDNSTNASDGNGHGTEVTDALLKAAPSATYVIVKAIANNGTGYESDVIRGLEVCRQQNASVVSLSIGSGLYSGLCDNDLLAQEANALVSSGTIVVAAAGNEGGPLLKAPACASNVTAVISTDANDSLASSSSYLTGHAILAAPGVNIETLDRFAKPTTASGTSMAAPLVSGAAALLLENDSNLTPLGVRSLLVDTGAFHNTSGFAYSRLDLTNALERNYTNHLSSTFAGASQGNGSSNGTVQTLTNINTCQNITATGSYTLTADVSSAGTCMNITTSNTVLNCAGHTITYGQSNRGYGVYVWNASNATVRNCKIVEGSSNHLFSYGVVSNGSSSPLAIDWNLTLENLKITTLSDNSSGLYNGYAPTANITNVTITTTGNYSEGATTSPIGLTDNYNYTDLNVTTTGRSSIGVLYLGQGAKFVRAYIHTSGSLSYGFKAYSSETIYDSTINATAAKDIYFDGGGSWTTNLHLINVTYNTTDVVTTESMIGSQLIGGGIYTGWHATYNVTDTSGGPLSNALVYYTGARGGNPSGDYLHTDANGLVKSALYGFFKNYTGTYSFDNYTIYATKTGYDENSTNLNATGNSYVHLELPIKSDTVCVKETSTCFNTIQKAVNHATAGQTVVITDNATYPEQVRLNKSITLTQNATSGHPALLAPNTSIIVNVSGVKVECGGMSIQYAASEAGNGFVLTNGASNARIVDCNITQDSAQSNSVGILGNGTASAHVNNVSVINGSVSALGISPPPAGTSPGAIVGRHSHSWTVSGVQINDSTYGAGINASDSPGWTISDTAVTVTSGDALQGVNSTNWNLSRVNITSTVGIYSYGIYALNSSGWNASTLRIRTGGEYADGIHALHSPGWSLHDTNSTATFQSANGVYAESSNWTITNSTIGSYGLAGNGLYAVSSNGWSIDGLLIHVNAQNNWGLIMQDSNDWVSTGLNVSTIQSGSTALVLYGSSNGTLIANSSFHAANDNDVLMEGSSGAERLYLVNDTYREAYVSFNSATAGTLYRGWYLDAYVNDTYGNAISGASVGYTGTAPYVSENPARSGSSRSASNGHAASVALYQYFENYTGTYHYGNYTINVSKLGYDPSNGNHLNVTGNLQRTYTLGLTLVGSCGTISSAGAYDLSADLSATGTCVTINASNTFLNCAGHTINYSQSSAGSGIKINGGEQNVTVENCVIVQGSTSSSSIALDAGSGTNNGLTLRNLTVETRGTSSYGVSVDSSSYLNLSQITATTYGRSAYALFAYSVLHSNYSRLNLTTYGNASYVLQTLNTAFNDSFDLVNLTGWGGSNYGFYAQGFRHSNMTNSRVVMHNGSGTGILDYGAGSQANALFENVSITTTGNSGYGFQLYLGDFTYFRNLTIHTTGPGAPAFIQQQTSNTSITGFNITSDQSIALYPYGSSTTNSAQYINGSLHTTSGVELETDPSFSGSVAIINVSFDPASVSIGAGAIEVGWYVNTYVDNTSGAPQAATVSYSDSGSHSSTNLDASGTFSTGSDGYHRTQVIYSYHQSSTGNYSYGPYTYTASKSGYGTALISATITGNEQVNLTLPLLVSACGLITSPGTYGLSADVSGPGTCVEIDANNVQFGCAGHTVTFNTAGGSNEKGIYVNGNYNNTIITDCNVVEGNASGQGDEGVFYYGHGQIGQNLTISNVNVTMVGNQSYSMYLYQLDTASVTNTRNTITTPYLGGGLQLSVTNRVNVTGYHVNRTGGSWPMFYMTTGTANNTILKDATLIRSGSTTGSDAIVAYAGSVNVAFENITINDSAAGGDGGLDIETPATVKNVTITMTGGSGVSSGAGITHIAGGSNLSNIYVWVNGTNMRGVALRSATKRVWIDNLTAYSKQYYAVETYLENNSLITNANITSDTSTALHVDTSDNITLINSTIHTTTGTDVGITSDTGSEGVKLINTTHNATNDYIDTNPNSVLHVAWYLNAYVNDTSGNPISGATVSYTDNGASGLADPTASGSATTGPGGHANVPLYEYSMNGSTTTSYSNYTIGASKFGYYSPSNSPENMTTNKQLGFTLTQVACGAITSSVGLSSDLSSTGSCFNITASNVVLNCGGHSINFSQSSTGFGIYVVSGLNNVTIENCKVYQTNSTVTNAINIYLAASTSNVTIANSFVSRKSPGTSSAGGMGAIAVSGTSDLLIRNTTSLTWGTYDTALYIDAVNSTIRDSNFTAYDFDAVDGANYVDNLSFANDQIYGKPSSGYGALYFVRGLFGTFGTVRIYNSTIHNPVAYSVADGGFGGTAIYLVNTTYDNASATVSTFHTGWYTDLYVNRSTGVPLVANVSYTDNGAYSSLNPTSSGTVTTASNGYYRNLVLYEYSQNYTGTYYHTDYTLEASKYGYTHDSKNANVTTNAQYNFTISNPAPNVKIIRPVNDVTRYAASSAFNVLYTATDNAAVSACWYSLNGAVNVSLTGCANFSVTAVDGKNNLTIYANDTTDQIGSASVSFTWHSSGFCDTGSLATICTISTSHTLGNNTEAYGNDLNITSTGALSTAALERLTLNFTGWTDVHGNISANVNLTATNITVYTSGVVNSSGLGYPGAQCGKCDGTGPGKGLAGAGGEGAGGAGHAGFGGNGSYAAGGPEYGSLEHPTEYGSGGGKAFNGGQGGDGGGSITLTASGAMVINGTVTSDGVKATPLYNGGGSGGSIIITTGSLSGNGEVTSRGGDNSNGLNIGGGGSGGRIAIYYSSTSYSGHIRAGAGLGYQNASSGTIYYKDTSTGVDTAYLINSTSDRGRNIWYYNERGENPANVYLINSKTYVNTSNPVNLGNLHLEKGSVLTVIASQPEVSYVESKSGVKHHYLNITATSVTIDPTSQINLSKHGYPGANSSSIPSGFGPGGGNTSTTYGGGGGYGGAGGNSNNEPGGSAYGSASLPSDLGSGGGYGGLGTPHGGRGGGLVILDVSKTFVLDGLINASGQHGLVGSGSRFSGAGSGGSILIIAGTFEGNGTIQTSGGNNKYNGGTGGGGRAAVYATYYNFSDTPTNVTDWTPHGGTGGYQTGSNGTIYRHHAFVQALATQSSGSTYSLHGKAWLFPSGSAISGYNVSVYVDGSFYANATTNSSGEYTTSYTAPSSGSYSIRVVVNDTAAGLAAENHNTFTVPPESCGNLSSSKTLYGDVSSAGTCFNITASNVVLNCAGYTINYSQSTSGTGIVVQAGINNISVTNCHVVQGSTSSTSYGLDTAPARGFTNIGNLTIENSSFTTEGSSSDAIHLYNVGNGAASNITNVTISVNGAGSAGVSYYTALAAPTQYLSDVTINATGNHSVGLRTYMNDPPPWNATRLTINASGPNAYGIDISYYSNLFIADSSIFGNAGDINVSSTASNGYHADLVNTTLVSDTIHFPTGVTTYAVHVGWYADLYVNDTTGSPLVANVSYTDNGATSSLNPSSNGSVTSAADGYYRNLVLYEYTRNYTGTYYHTNYTLNASKPGYTHDTLSANVTADTQYDFTISNPPPTVTIVYPPNGTVRYGSNDTFKVRFTATDNTAVSACWYSLNGAANVSLPGCANFSVTAVDGKNNLTVYANDTTGLIGSKTTTFTWHASGFCDSGNLATTCVVSTSHTLTNNTEVDGNNLNITSTGVLTSGQLESFTLTFTGWTDLIGNITANVNITTTNINVSTGSTIDAAQKGYAGSQGPGAGVDGGPGACYSEGGGGGGHAGYGGSAVIGPGAGGSPNGNLSYPLEFGSGGGKACGQQGSPGGGRILIKASGTARIDGTLTAPGSVLHTWSGSGAGGSIIVDAGTLTGSGLINVSGANGVWSDETGPGSAGRVALYYTNYTFSGSFDTRGGWGRRNASSGSIYRMDRSGSNDSLTVTNTRGSAAAFLLSNNVTKPSIDAITITGQPTTIDMPSLTSKRITLINTTVTSFANSDVNSTDAAALVKKHYINITTVNLTIGAGSSINVSTNGYPSTEGPGAGGNGYPTSGCYGSLGGGGGYGGAGGKGSYSSATGGSTYGSASDPEDLGSAGGKACTYPGSAGGGLVIINASGVVVIDGSIGAHGENPINIYGGMGSGGSILIRAGTFEGNGIVEANGGTYGTGSTNQGGGGGGRIAVYATYYNFSDTPTNVTNWTPIGGHGYRNGADGTIYRDHAFVQALATQISGGSYSLHGLAWTFPTDAPIAGENVSVYVNGTLYTTTTNASGDYTVSYTAPAAGSYSLRVVVNDTAAGLAAENHNTFTVPPESCGSLSSSTTLYSDVSSTGTCFNITTSNVTLDCAGHTISYGSGSQGYGVYVSPGVINATIRDCVITQTGSTDYSHGVFIDGRLGNKAANVTVTSSNLTTVANSSSGVYATNTIGANLTNVRINASGNSTYGIFDWNASSSVFDRIVITTIGNSSQAARLVNTAGGTYTNLTVTTSENASYGLFFQNATTSSLTDITITTSGNSSHAIVFQGTASAPTTDVNVTGATLTTSGSSSDGLYETNTVSSHIVDTNISLSGASSYGIFSLNSTNRSLTNVNITTIGSTSYGLRIVNGDGAASSNLRISTSGSSGIGISTDNLASSSFDGLTISTLGANAHALLLEGSSANNVFDRVNFTTNSTFSEGVYLGAGSNANTIANGSITTAISNVVYVDTNSPSNANRFINVSFSGPASTFQASNDGSIERGWYVDLYVNDTAGSPLAANVSYADNGLTSSLNPSPSGTVTTASNGYYTNLALYEYTQNDTGTYYHTNYTFNGSASGYQPSSLISENITGDRQTNLTLAPTSCGNLTSSYTLASDVSSTGTCFNITASNVVLNCAGHSIDYASSTRGYAIVASPGVSNISILNCNITESGTSPGSIGVLFNGSTASFSGLNISKTSIDTVTINSSAIYLRNATSAALSHLTIDTRSHYADGILLVNATSTTVMNSNITLRASATAVSLVNSSGTILSDLVINATGQYGGFGLGLDLSSASTNIVLRSSHIYTTGANSTLIELPDSSELTVTGTTLGMSSGQYGIEILGTAVAWIYNSSISVPSTAKALLMGSSVNNPTAYLINTTFNDSSAEFNSLGRIHRGWYVDLYVNDTAGSPLAANVSYAGNGVTSSLNPSSGGVVTTAADGYYRNLVLYEWSENSTGRYYHTNYTLNASKYGYGIGRASYNLTGNAQLNVMIQDIYVNNVVLSATSPANLTSDNLSVSFDAGSATGNPVYNSTDWRVDGKSIAVLNLPFDTNVTSTASGAVKDLSTYANNATLGSGNPNRAPEWTPNGISGGAYTFNGSDKLKVPLSTSLNLSTNFTVMLWAKTNKTQSNSYPFLISAGSNQKWQIYIDCTTGCSVSAALYNNTGQALWVGYGDINTSTWDHLTLTFNGTNALFYLNGSLLTDKRLNGTLATGSYPISIGYDGGGGSYYTGSIDDIHIFNRVLSASQIKSFYTTESVGHAESAIAWQETRTGENWSVAVTTSDGTSSATTLSNDLTIIGPLVTYVHLNATSPANLTSDNLTVSFNTSNSVSNATDWRIDGRSIAVLDLPFDTNVTSGAAGAVPDLSTYGNNATLSSANSYYQPHWIANGKVGGAYHFRGYYQNMTVASSPSLELTKGFTIMFWMKASRRQVDSYPILISKGLSTNGGISYYVDLDHGAPVYHSAICLNASTGAMPCSGIGASLNDSTWHFITYTWNTTTMLAYLDASLVQTKPMSLTLRTNNRSLYMGDLNGSLDEVRIFNRPLSAAQIASMYAAESSGHAATTIVSNETRSGQNWSVAVTTSDTHSSDTIVSNTVTISSTCGQISNDTTLVNDVSAAGTCFNITASNVTLNCAGHTINYSQSGTGVGIYANSGLQNVSIENCNIYQANNLGSSSSQRPGIELSGSAAGNITHLSIVNTNITTYGNSSAGISGQYVKNVTITNTRVIAYGQNLSGIWVGPHTDHWSMTGVNVTARTGNLSIGVNAYASISWNITDTSISANNTALYSAGNSSAWTITHSNLSAFGPTGEIVRANHAVGWSLSNDRFLGGGAGMLGVFAWHSGHWNLSNIDVQLTGGGAKGLYGAYTSDVNVRNATIRSAYYTLELASGSDNWTIVGLNVSATGSDEAVLITNSTGSYIYNSSIQTPFIHKVRLDLMSELNAVYFINDAFNDSAPTFLSNGRLYRGWYADYYVNDTTGAAISGASVTYADSGTNSALNPDASGVRTTDGTGHSRNNVVYQYVENATGRYSFDNYTFNASATGYQPSSLISENITANTQVNITLTQTSCGNLTSSYTLTSDVSAPGTCFNITASNVVLNCAGHTIKYDQGGTGYGILIWSKNGNTRNVTIENCNVTTNSTAGGATTPYPAIVGYGVSHTPSGSLSDYSYLPNYLDNVTIVNTSISTAGNSDYGIFADRARNWTISNVRITTTNYYADGIHADYTDSWTVENTTVDLTGFQPNALLAAYSNRWTIVSSRFNTTNTYGVGLNIGLGNSSVSSTVISSTGSFGYGIKWNWGDNLTISDSPITGASTIYINGGVSSSNIYLVNVSFDSSKISFVSSNTRIHNGWHVSLYTNDTTGIPLAANVSYSDNGVTSSLDPSSGGVVTTAADGYYRNLVLYEWSENSTARYYHTNYTLNASKPGYTRDTLSANVTTNAQYNFTIQPDTTPPTWKNNWTNATTTTPKYGQGLRFNLTMDDNGALGYYVFSTNASGTWVNDSPVSMSDLLEYNMSLTKTGINQPRGSVIGWRVYFNDSVGNKNETPIFTVVMRDTPPPVPVLHYPANGEAFLTNRTPRYNWTEGSDVDGDPITYVWQLSLDQAFTTLVGSNASISTKYYDEQTPLDFTTYWWHVAAYDGYEYSSNSTAFNFTVTSLISINLTNSTVDFGTMALGDQNDTTNGVPPPITVINTGNIKANISINASPLWTTAGLGTRYYQAKARVDQIGAFNTGASAMSYLNLTASGQPIITNLDWQSTADHAYIDLHVQAPLDEYPGNHSSTLRVIAS